MHHQVPGSALNGGNFAAKGVQLDWLKKDLETARSPPCTTPWIIVLGHRPWYGSVPWYSEHAPKSDNCDTCRNAFAELLFNNTVDFYFSGHVHWYERLLPVDRNGNYSCDNYNEPQGPIYITTGAGGAPEGAQNVSIKANASAIVQSTYGFSQLNIIDSNRAELYFYNSSNLAELDHISVDTKLTNVQTHVKFPTNSK